MRLLSKKVNWVLHLAVCLAVISWNCNSGVTTNAFESGPGGGENHVVKVEEDWELVIGDPDTVTNSPQVSCAISPHDNLEGLFGVFEVNYQSMPDYEAGGLQIQVWDNDEHLLLEKYSENGVLATSGETIKWTMRMSIFSGSLKFKVLNGTSDTWNTFGAGTSLTASVSTEDSDLDGYSPDASVANSGIGFGQNRVNSMILKRVRYYYSNGDVTEDSTERVVYSSDE